MADQPEVVETTTRRRIIPVAKERSTPEFWEYLSRLSPTDWQNHILYVYREQPGPRMQVAKCTTQILEGTSSSWGDQEEMEAAFAQKFGGQQFRVIVKRGAERVTEGRLYIDAPAKNLMRPPDNPSFNGPTVQPSNGYGYGDTARVAETAIHTMANQDKQAMDIAVSAVSQAARVIKDFSSQPPPTPSETDNIMKMMMVKMMERMMQPPADPLDLLTKVLALQAQLNPGSNSNPMLAKVMDVAIEKILNPPPSGPAVSMGAELLRQLPQLAQYVAQAMAENRMTAEAQRDALAIQRNAAPPNGAPPQQIIRPAQALPPTPAPAPTNGAPMADSMQFIESKVIEILAEPESAESCAEQAIDFLDRLDAGIVPQLAGQGEAGLMALFQTRQTLKPALANLGRVQDFVRAFVKFAGENGLAAPDATKPN